MNQSQILLAPVVSEKSTEAQAARKYTFRVNLKANKIEIAKAVEEAYGVTVEAVNIIPVAKKIRRVGRTKVITKRPMARKAVVTLKPKPTFDLDKLKTSEK